jgi:AraC-like DNA-binding protein
MAVSVYQGGQHFIIGDAFLKKSPEQALVTEKREIYSFPFGNAELVELAFSDVYIVYGDMLLYDERRIYFELIDNDDLVEMHFTLAGNGELQNVATGKNYFFKTNEHNLHYTPAFRGAGVYEGQTLYKFFEVHFTRRFFQQLAKDSSPILMQFAENIDKNNLEELSHDNLPISFAMHQCIRDIMDCRLTGGLKLLFLQSKSIELLALQAQMYEDAAGKKSLVCKSGHDRDCIHFAKDYLLQHALQPPSLTELAKIAGINEFKLKQGFKEQFNNTVFGYLADFKLLQARELLLAGNYTIKSVAEQLGYSSVQHFNTAFRKKFGVPPGKIKSL